MAADFIERDTAGFLLGCAAAAKVAISIVGVACQFLDNLGFPRGSELETR